MLDAMTPSARWTSSRTNFLSLEPAFSSNCASMLFAGWVGPPVSTRGNSLDPCAANRSPAHMMAACKTRDGSVNRVCLVRLTLNSFTPWGKGELFVRDRSRSAGACMVVVGCDFARRTPAGLAKGLTLHKELRKLFTPFKTSGMTLSLLASGHTMNIDACGSCKHVVKQTQSKCVKLGAGRWLTGGLCTLVGDAWISVGWSAALCMQLPSLASPYLPMQPAR